MEKLRSVTTWLNTNLLLLLSIFLIAFIPLFPKIPLFDILPGYIVRVRAEDFLVIFAALAWLRDAFYIKNTKEKQFEWNTPYFWLVIAYASVGVTSIFLGTILLQSIPTELLHIGKSGLHFFRYMEYFALFFFLYSSVKTKLHLKIILVTLVITVIGIIGYGYGQQFLHFPLYSTMNREYSKGEKLYLQENARPQSTFAGHYDLGAYLVIVLPIILALSLGLTKILPAKTSATKKTILLLILHSTHLFGAWMLVSSGSKTALAAYILGILVVIFFNLKKISGIKQKLKWAGISLLIFTVILGTTVTFFGQETKSMIISIAQKNQLANKVVSKIPGITQNQQIDKSIPEDLYGEGHEYKLEITTDEFGNKSEELVQQKSTWSANALKYGISMGIRLDTLWPQAIKGLINNPLFGNGYATLSQFQEGQFSEADSTDNNFLRTLGETGILGFITFYGLIIYILKNLIKNTKNSSSLVSTINIGLTGSVLGLLVNASYIDVFAASKVAFTFWALVGVGIKSGELFAKTKEANIDFSQNILLHFKKHKYLYFSLLILFFTLHKNPYKDGSMLKNIQASDESIENLVSSKCYLETGEFSVCNGNGLNLKNNLNLYSILLIPFMKISSQPTTFYFLNILLNIAIIIIIYKLIYLTNKNEKDQQKLGLLTFSSLLLAISILYFYNSTSQPLTSRLLLKFYFFTPILSISLVKFLMFQRKRISIVFSAVMVLLIILGFQQTNILQKIKFNFRNNQKAYQNWAVNRSNLHFISKSLLNDGKQSYLASIINPYYFSLYKNDKYQLLPASTSQPYFNNATKVWNDLYSENEKVDIQKTYQKIINNQDRLYITDFGIDANQLYKNSFDEIKNNFNISYEVIDCDEKCNLYKIDNKKDIILDIPLSTNNHKLNLDSLDSNYSFFVFNHNFESVDKSSENPYDTSELIKNLKSNNIQNNKETFGILSGKLIHKNEPSWRQFFSAQFDNVANYPIIKSPDAIKKYYRFFTKNDYYIFLDLNEQSEITALEKLFVYNSLLELEKMPEIKNVFIVSYNLDWQNSNNNYNDQPDNFIHLLEKKLDNFPKLNKYLISSNHEKVEAGKYTSNFAQFYDQQKNIYYLATTTNDQSTTSYLQFNVDENSKVSFKEMNYKN